MATYKLIQDIEAEDKILGPLTLRQFIFGLITAFLLYICFVCIERGFPILLVIFLPPAILTGFFAFPFGRDQPTEVWALGKLRFWFKPRQRIWDQSGIKELVTITVPKKIQHVYTDGLSRSEVQSRLHTLANTIDSRGWAVKSMAVNDYYSAGPLAQQGSDRLLDIDAVPQEVSDTPVQASDDILDEQNNPIAQQFQTMINQSSQAHRQQLVEELKSGKPANDSSAGWFVPSTPTPSVPVVTAADGAVVNAAPDDPGLSAQLKAQHVNQNVAYGNLRSISPVNSRPPVAPAAILPAPVLPAIPPAAITDDRAMTTRADPAIMNLANNDDLNVATIAREAKKAKGEEPGQAEVVISLH